MRTIVAVVLALSILFLGFQAIGMQMEQADSYINSTNTTNATEGTFNMTQDVYTGVSDAVANAAPWVGVAAAVLVALGFLAFAWRGGGR